MKATIRAQLKSIGHLETTEGGVLIHALVLIGETTDDVRAFAPFLTTDIVTLRVERLEDGAHSDCGELHDTSKATAIARRAAEHDLRIKLAHLVAPDLLDDVVLLIAPGSR